MTEPWWPEDPTLEAGERDAWQAQTDRDTEELEALEQAEAARLSHAAPEAIGSILGSWALPISQPPSRGSQAPQCEF